MLPRDVPLAPRARLRDVLAGRARLVGARTAVGQDALGLTPGIVSPYEARAAMGLRYGDPAIEEARHDQARTRGGDVALLARWAVAKVASLGGRKEEARESRPLVVSARVDAIDTGEAISRILAWLGERRPGSVFFVHPHALNLAARDPSFRDVLQSADLVLPDGIGLRVAASILGEKLTANVNGTDLVPELLVELAAEGVPVALIGGAPGVADKAATVWSARTRVRVQGVWDGFRDEAAYRAVAEELRAAGPCVVLVAMGSPHQERFVRRFLADLPHAVTITVGGLFDFASGEKPRAPMAWRELGLEWLFRLLHEPRRLGRRYLLGNPEFMARAALQRLRGTDGS